MAYAVDIITMQRFLREQLTLPNELNVKTLDLKITYAFDFTAVRRKSLVMKLFLGMENSSLYLMKHFTDQYPHAQREEMHPVY